MKNDDLLIKEAQRQQKLLRDSGLDQYVKRLQDPIQRQLLEEASRRTLSPLNDQLNEMTQRAHARMAAALEKPLHDALRGLQERIHSSYLGQYQKIQKDFAEHLSTSLRIPELGSFKSMQETLIRQQALELDKMFRPAQMNAMLDAARFVTGSNQLRDLFAFQMQDANRLRDFVANSMRAVFEVSRFVDLNASLKNFPESFAAEMLARLPKHEPADVARLDDAELAELQEEQLAFFSFLIEKLRELDPAWVNLIAVFGLIWAFGTFAWQEYSNDQMEQRILAAITDEKAERKQQLETAIAEQLSRLVPQNPAPTLFVVERTAKLKLSVKPGSPTVAVLPPNQTVELLAERGKWIYVQFFDYLEGIPRQGWVLKKYLKRVPAARN